jgi:hypothetical protein
MKIGLSLVFLILLASCSLNTTPSLNETVQEKVLDATDRQEVTPDTSTKEITQDKEQNQNECNSSEDCPEKHSCVLGNGRLVCAFDCECTDDKGCAELDVCRDCFCIRE